MARVTVAHLTAVLHAIECMNTAAEAGAEDQGFLEDARLASEVRPWIQAEIRRRKNGKLIRQALAKIGRSPVTDRQLRDQIVGEG